MGIRGHFPSLLLDSKDLFLLTIYENFFYFNTSSLPKIILLAHWVSILTMNKSVFFVFFPPVVLVVGVVLSSNFSQDFVRNLNFLTWFLYFNVIPSKGFQLCCQAFF